MNQHEHIQLKLNSLASCYDSIVDKMEKLEWNPKDPKSAEECRKLVERAIKRGLVKRRYRFGL